MIQKFIVGVAGSFSVLLEYKGNRYLLEDKWTNDWEDVDTIRYVWDGMGNFDCDCNLGNFILSQFPNAPEELDDMPCGDTIKLISHWAFEVKQ